MHILECFEHRSDGTWECRSPCTFEGPNGRVQVAVGTRLARGERYMGADLAQWLDERLARLRACAAPR